MQQPTASIQSPLITKQSIPGIFALDLSSWRLEQELKHSPESSTGKPNPLWVIKNSRDGRFIASGANDGSIKIWTLASDPLNAKTKSQLGRQRSATTEDIKLPGKRFYKLENGQAIFDPLPLQHFSGHMGAITDFSWSFSHYFLLSASLDQTVRLWNISNSQCLCVFFHADVVSSVKFHPTEHHLFLSGAFDGRIRLWSILEKKVIHWNQVPNNSITAVEITLDGNTAIAGTLNGDLLFYGLPYLKYETEITITPSFRALRLNHSRTQYKINGIESFVDYHSGEHMMVVNSTDSKIRIYQIRDKSLSKSFKGHICQSSLFRPNISENGMILLSPSEDKSIYFWKNTEEILEYPVGPAGVLGKQANIDRLVVDEQVLCAQFASSKIYFWKNSFSNAFSGESANHADLNEPLVLLTSDLNGRICIYRNEISSAALTVRSFKDVAISPQSLKQIRKKTNSPITVPKNLSARSSAAALHSIFMASSRESLPEIKDSTSESIISVDPLKQVPTDLLFNSKSVKLSRLSPSFESQIGVITDLKEEGEEK